MSTRSSFNRQTIRAAAAELRDRGDAHAAEVEMRLCATHEAALLAEAEQHEQARRDRQRRARDAARAAAAALRRELETPLCERAKR